MLFLEKEIRHVLTDPCPVVVRWALMFHAEYYAKVINATTRTNQLRSTAFGPLQPAERRPILGGKQIGHLRKHRHAMDGVSMRPSKIGRSEGTR